MFLFVDHDLKGKGSGAESDPELGDMQQHTVKYESSDQETPDISWSEIYGSTV